MQYSIGLQDPYSDSAKWVIILAGMLIAAGCMFLFFLINRRRSRDQAAEAVQVNADPQPEYQRIKYETLHQLDDIEKNYRSGRMSVRETSCKISFSVRSFITSMTGGNAVCKTLSELQGWNRPELTMLIRKLYGAQFTVVSSSDAGDYFRDARKLVEKWK